MTDLFKPPTQQEVQQAEANEHQEDVKKALTDHRAKERLMKLTGNFEYAAYLLELIELKDRLFDPRCENPTAEEMKEKVKPCDLHFFKSMCEVLREKL